MLKADSSFSLARVRILDVATVKYLHCRPQSFNVSDDTLVRPRKEGFEEWKEIEDFSLSIIGRELGDVLPSVRVSGSLRQNIVIHNRRHESQ